MERALLQQLDYAANVVLNGKPQAADAAGAGQ